MKPREQFLQDYQSKVLNRLPLPPGLREQYSLQACLKDGERQVYLLQDRKGCPAVLKLQPAGREDTLRQEYDLLQQLRHPQLPRPLAFVEWKGTEYLVREYVEGISLYERVTSQGPFSPAQVRLAALSLCQVLRYLHSRTPPVLCRDVKPQNVVMDSEGCCRPPLPAGAGGGHGSSGYAGHRPAGTVRLPANGSAFGHIQSGNADAFSSFRQLCACSQRKGSGQP